MSLGQISHQLQNHQNQTNNNILRLGSSSSSLSSTPKFEQQLISSQQSLNHHSSFSPFFMNDIPNQSSSSFDQEHQFTNKQLHGLMQLPDLQGNNTNNNVFNLMNNIHDHHQFNNTLIFDQNMSSDPHIMSATALLQKASQIGSTNSTNNNKGNTNTSFGNRSSSMENDDHDNNIDELHGLINSIANGNTSSSIFGNDDENNLNMRFGGSDKLTLDFLGVGGMVRNMNSGAGFSQHAMNTSMASLNHDLKSVQSSQSQSQHFGSSNFMQ
jgi:hypothetical protein